MILPIIELDMTQKNKVYTLPTAAFTGEDNVYTIQLKPVDYDWTDKVAALVFSAVSAPSQTLDVTDGVVSMLVNSAWVTAGLNRLQLNIYSTDGTLHEQAPIVEWYVRQSLPATDPAPERVDLMADLLGQVNTTVESLATVETTCTEAAAAAAQSVEDAGQAAIDGLDATLSTMGATATTLPPSTPATATLDKSGEVWEMSFGIPQGPQGLQGEQGEQGEQGIPGADGLTISVNGIEQIDGNVTLTLDDIPDGLTRKLQNDVLSSELADVRVGYDGTVYDTAGDAVRGQAEQLSGEIDDLVLGVSRNLTEYNNPLHVAAGSVLTITNMTDTQRWTVLKAADGTEVYSFGNVKAGTTRTIVVERDAALLTIGGGNPNFTASVIGINERIDSKVSESVEPIENTIDNILNGNFMDVGNVPSGYNGVNYSSGAYTAKGHDNVIDAGFSVAAGGYIGTNLYFSTAGFTFFNDEKCWSLVNDEHMIAVFDYDLQKGDSDTFVPTLSVRCTGSDGAGQRFATVEFDEVGSRIRKTVDLTELISSMGGNVAYYTLAHPSMLIGAGLTAVDDYSLSVRFHGIFTESQVKQGFYLAENIRALQGFASDNAAAIKENEEGIESNAVAINSLYAIFDRNGSSIDSDALLYRAALPDYYTSLPSTIDSFEDDEYLESCIKRVPDGKHFIFVADTHWPNNAKHSNQMIAYVRKRLGIEKVIFGGDVITRGFNKYTGWAQMASYMNEAKAAFGKNLLVAIGNHDANTANITPEQVQALRIPWNVIRDTMLGHLDGTIVTPEDMTETLSDYASGDDLTDLAAFYKTFYYIDDDVNGIRYIVLNSDAPKTVTAEYLGVGGNASLALQLDWLYETLMDVPSTYDVVLAAHQMTGIYHWIQSIQQQTVRMLTYLKTKGVYNLDYTGSECPLYTQGNHTYDFTDAPNVGKAFVLAGHVHYDSEMYVSAGGIAPVDGAVDNSNGQIPVVTILCDAHGSHAEDVNSPSFEEGKATWYDMTQGTVTEQCFDVATLTDEGIEFTRFGAGIDRTLETV